MRIGVLAGEASGDILGARLLAALHTRCPGLVVEGIGGPLMEAQGLRSMVPMERLSVMGFVEPLQRLPELLRIRRSVHDHFVANPPDLFLGIDSPDFNLQLERRLRRRGIVTAHLVSPSVWAWRSGRVRGIRRSVDLMLCLFPFETAVYARHGVPARFVGHPLADEIPASPDRDAARRMLGLAAGGKLLALLPGSRSGEVRLLAPVFLQAARLLRQRDPALAFVLPASSAARAAELEGWLADYPDLAVTLVSGRSRDVMTACDAVLLASGTATLEAALLNRPMVVAYRMGWLSWLLLKQLVRTPFAALPNILASRPLVPELLQDAATPAALAGAVQPLLADGAAASAQRQAFIEIHRDLSQGFGERCAEALLALAAAGELIVQDLFACDYHGPGLAGVDEAGRGPLAGDVVAAAVMLDPARPIAGLRDSKKLSAARREQLALLIMERALAWSVARATVAEIDQLNILQASLLAMHRAVQALQPQPAYVLVDGNRLPRWPYPSEPVVRGDDRVPAIAAASILAKVQRDRELVELERRYPGYGFATHKGYPTVAHLEALRTLGVTPVHRRTFAPVRALLQED